MSIISEQFQKLFGGQPPVIPSSEYPLWNDKTASRYNTTFLLDLTTLKYGHMNDNCRELVGYSGTYLKDGGVDSYVDLWTSAGIETYSTKILPITFQYLSSVPTSRASDLVFGRTYFVKSKQGDTRKIFERDVFLFHPSCPSPVAVAGYATDITHVSDSNNTIFFIEDCSQKGVRSLLYKEVMINGEEHKILTRKEMEVLKWMAEGFSSKQIADKMQISQHTVNNHRKNMLEKTNCLNSAELITYALRQNWL
jgi:DNA-binding CsgD family transcriptional regulator